MNFQVWYIGMGDSQSLSQRQIGSSIILPLKKLLDHDPAEEFAKQVSDAGRVMHDENNMRKRRRENI